ncbi:MAG: tetratricopeptide repeat protein, partial [Pyrinomonadaceae bacterium]
MKKCPQCNREYDNSMSFCLDDGSELLYGPAFGDEPATAILSEPEAGGALAGASPSGVQAATGFPDDEPTQLQIHTTDQTAVFPRETEARPQESLGGLSERQSFSSHKVTKPLVTAAIAALVLIGGFFGYRYFAPTKQIVSIAVMPFVNESGNADVEYLSDGMTETLISSLSQIPNLTVKARSSVFRYKSKETDAQTIGKELKVQAILNGRVVQRGQDLILYVELVDAATENSLWKQSYNKTMTNLVALQNDIARDVADKLKVKLSRADEQKLAKKYTENAEAYKLYLRGRYHLLKLTPSEIQTGISYYQQAIEIDSNYALAYAGLSEAYRTYAVAADLEPTEFLPKAKAAANKAIEIDDSLAEAHTVLGVAVFWGDWNWKEAENQYKRALELNPNNADAHMYYAHLLSIMGRHTEALAEVKLARELEPLDLRINTLEAQFLIHARQPDEALARLQETFKLDPDYWLAHSFAASAYIEKGMYAEAVAEARRARNLFDGGIQA